MSKNLQKPGESPRCPGEYIERGPAVARCRAPAR